MPHYPCTGCQELIWDRTASLHCCKPLFHVINRESWFEHNDEREISDLSQKEFDEIDWGRAVRAMDAADAAKRYLERRYNYSDGVIEEMEVYVKDGLDRITRHMLVAELVVEVRSVKYDEIQMPEHIEMCV